MKTPHTQKFLIPLTALIAGSVAFAARLPDDVSINKLGTYSTGIFSDEVSGAEISAHDPKSQRLFVVNGADSLAVARAVLA